MHLELFEEAAAEIEEDRTWYRKRSESAEAGFLRELDHAMQQVTDFPAQWPQYLAGTQRYVFPAYPHSLVYFVENDIVRGADGGGACRTCAAVKSDRGTTEQ